MAKRRTLNPMKTKLRNRVLELLDSRAGCMVAADMGTAFLVFVRRRFTVTKVINPDSMQPHTKTSDRDFPVPLLLIFDARDGVDKRMLARYHALGGDSVLVKSLVDATEALDGG